MRLPLLLLAAAPLLLATAAEAQWYDGGRGGFGDLPPPPYGYGRRVLPRDAIVDRLEELGFDDIGRPRLDGDVYTVTATNPSGVRVRVAVDAHRGTLLRRIGRTAPDALEDDFVGPGRRGYNAPPEMPGAPGYREPPPLYAGRPETEEFVTPRIAPAAPVEAAPLASPSPMGPRALPADPRLAPGASAPLSEPRREPTPSAMPDRAGAPAAPGSVYGVNPQQGRPVDAKPPAARPARPAATSPAVPAPPPVDAKAAAEPKATAEAEPRRPVRVIPGVTPLNSGGAQATPGPQNNQAPKPPQ